MIKNVVIACDYAYVEGGASKVAIQTAVALSKHTDWKVYFLAGCGEPCEELVNNGVEVVALRKPDLLGNPNILNAFVNGIYNDDVYEKINVFLQSLDACQTVMHVHTWTKVLSSAVFDAATQNHIPVFLTVHDYFLTCPNGGCYDYVANEICERVPLSASCFFCNCDARNYFHKIWRCLRQAKQNRVIRGIESIQYIFISEFEKKQILRRIPEIKHWHMLKNPISFSNRHRVKAEDNELYLFVGRISEEKGVSLFCEAVSKCKVKAAVIGDGRLREQLAREYPHITFTGWLSKSEIQKWIEGARCLVFPSLWYEGAPLTVPEVQAFGIPCIVTDCSAAVDNVVSGENGEVVKSTVADLVCAIGKMAEDEVGKKYSENTYMMFDESQGDEIRYVNELIQIYEAGTRHGDR